MTPVDISKAIETLSEIATVLSKLGIPGLIALALAGPAAVLGVILVLDFLRGRRTEKTNEQHRAENRAIIEQFRADMLAANERHRADTQAILREYGEKHTEALQFYRDNVELVKQYHRIANGFQDVVVNNTTAWGRMAGLAENNMYCPLAREAAKGKK